MTEVHSWTFLKVPNRTEKRCPLLRFHSQNTSIHSNTFLTLTSLFISMPTWSLMETKLDVNTCKTPRKQLLQTKTTINKYKSKQVFKCPYKSSTLQFSLLAVGKFSEFLKYLKRLQLLPAHSNINSNAIIMEEKAVSYNRHCWLVKLHKNLKFTLLLEYAFVDRHNYHGFYGNICFGIQKEWTF